MPYQREEVSFEDHVKPQQEIFTLSLTLRMFIWSTWQGTARVKPKNFMYHCPTTAQGMLSTMETLCDLYTKQESLHIGVLGKSFAHAKGNLLGITEKLTYVPLLTPFQ